jgi:hypothetical protein
LLGRVDVFLNRLLHCFNNKIRTILDSDGKVVGEEMVSDFFLEGLSYVCCNQAAYCGWYSKGAEF